MKFPREYGLKEIAEILSVPFVGSEDFPVLGLNEIHVVEAGDIVFVDHPKYYDKALQSAATVILINKKVDCPKGKALLISDNPFTDFNKLTKYFTPFVASKTMIAPTAKIGARTQIQPGVFVGNHVTIGEDCIIHPNVTIYDHVTIGNRVQIHAGSVLGADAFYYKNRGESWEKLESGGSVIIEDNVHIGAGCTIDRGVTANTQIKKHAKLDNQIQVGHDTVIGERCLIASQCGIAGCVVIENDVTLWGQVGITSGVTIGAKAIVLAQTGISKSLEGSKTYFGSPAEEARERLKQMALVKQIPEILKKIKEN